MSWVDSLLGTSRKATRSNKHRALALESLEERTLMTSYSVIGLDTLGGRRDYAYALNDTPTPVGESQKQGIRHFSAACWDTAGTKTEMGVLGGNKFSVAQGINNDGDIVGASNFSASPTAFHAFLGTCTNGGTTTDLGVLSGSGSSYAMGINASDVIAGYSNFSGGAADKYHATRYSGGSWADIHPPYGGDTSRAEDINNASTIVGYGNTSTSGAHTVAWSRTSSGSYTDLGILPDPGWGLGAPEGSEAYSINTAGVISGASYIQGGLGVKVYRAWIWESGFGLTDLGDLGLGGKHSRALGINDSKVVVGEANTTFGDSARNAFIWDSTNGIQNLNDMIPGGSGWVLNQAYDINNNGYITGWGIFMGKPKGFLLIPDPSPIPSPGPSIDPASVQDWTVEHALPLTSSGRARQQAPAVNVVETQPESKPLAATTPNIRVIAATAEPVEGWDMKPFNDPLA